MRHPKKEVQEAIEEITADGWFRLEPGGHWGVLLCGRRDRDGCRLYVNATPQNPGDHANKLRRQALNCTHRTERGATET